MEGLPHRATAVLPDGNVLISVTEQSGTRRLAATRGAGGWTVQERWTSNGLKALLQRLRRSQGPRLRLRRQHPRLHRPGGRQAQVKGGRYGNGQLVLLPIRTCCWCCRN